jgi:ABC-type multidrug transport system permease subunit
VIERRQGLLRRLASAPVSRSAIIIGKVAGRTLVALVQVAFAMAAGTWIFHVDWGPALPMVGVILGAWALFNAALAVLFGNLVRTEGQASGIGVVVSMTLAALGGAWWPIEITPAWMQKLALFIPTGWAMDAMHSLVNFAYGPASVLPHLLVLLAATLAVAWVAARTFRYS